MAAGLTGGKSSLQALASRIGTEYGCADVALVDSGTTALALAFSASAPSRRRPRVALPAYGCYDLMTAADAVDAEVALYDLDPATLAPDPDSLARATTAGIDAVVVAHWYGLPADLTQAKELAGRAGALLVEDAAQAVGASLQTGAAGSGGDFGVLSFGRGKGRTGGHGGALLANTPRAAALMRAVTEGLPAARGGLRDHAALLAQWLLGRPALYRIPSAIPRLRLGETPYRRPTRPTGMTPAAAAVVSSVWERSAREAVARRGNAERWARMLSRIEEVEVFAAPPNSTAGWLRFPARARGQSYEVLSGDRSRDCGVMRGYPKPLHALPLAPARLRNPSQGFPGAAELSTSLLTFPTHSLLRSDNVRAVARRLGVDGAELPP